jgi:hypothetical protein
MAFCARQNWISYNEVDGARRNWQGVNWNKSSQFVGLAVGERFILGCGGVERWDCWIRELLWDCRALDLKLGILEAFFSISCTSSNAVPPLQSLFNLFKPCSVSSNPVQPLQFSSRLLKEFKINFWLSSFDNSLEFRCFFFTTRITTLHSSQLRVNFLQNHRKTLPLFHSIHKQSQLKRTRREMTQSIYCHPTQGFQDVLKLPRFFFAKLLEVIEVRSFRPCTEQLN